MRTSKRRWGSAATRLRRRIAQVASTALALGVVGLAGVVGAAPAAAADPVGCSYGAGGPHAETICWIDFSDFDAGAAAAGHNNKIDCVRVLSGGDLNAAGGSPHLSHRAVGANLDVRFFQRKAQHVRRGICGI